MLNFLVFCVISLLFILLSYIFLPSTVNKNKRFDILLLFLIIFILSGRVLELIFLKDISTIGWSILPITDDSQNIYYFSKFPWFFVNLSQTIYLWFWLLFRFFISILFIRVFFKLKPIDFQGIKSSLFYVTFLVFTLFSVWFDIVDSVSDIIEIYSIVLTVSSVILFIVYVFFRYYKNINLSISWGIILIIAINLFMLVFYSNGLEGNKFIIEVITGILLIILENFKVILNPFLKTRMEESKISRTIIARNQYSEKNKRNWINEINSKYKKN